MDFLGAALGISTCITTLKVHIDVVPAAHACRSDKFRCDSGQCIYNDWRCNGFVHCTDASDENNCSKLGLRSFKLIIVKFCCHPFANFLTRIRNFN